MSPDFALSLSFEGIRLYGRTPEGWRELDHVPLDAPDLGRRLAALRTLAQTRAPEGFATRVVLPDEQIRYLALGTPEAGEAEARQALEGLTPYPVSDLVVDHLPGAGVTHVAAIARETLDEAEAFARDNGLAPACFVAWPDPSVFPGEAFFGPAAGTTGVARETRLPVLGPLAAAEAGAPGAVPPPGADAAGGEPPAAAPGASLPEPGGAPDAGDGEAPDAAGARAGEAEADEPPAEKPPSGEPPSDEPPAGGPRPEAAADGTGSPPPVPDEAADTAAPEPEPIFASHAPPIRGPAASGAGSWAIRAAAAPAESPSAAPLSPPPPPRPAARSPVQPGRRATPQRPPEGVPLAETERLTIFGARKKAPPPPRRSRSLGLVLTAVLLLVMLAVGVLAAVGEGGLTALLRRDAPPAVAAIAPQDSPAPPPAAAEDGGALAALPPPDAAPSAPAVAETATPAAATAVLSLDEPAPAESLSGGALVTPEEAERVYAATGVWLRPPRLPLRPEGDAGPRLAAALAADKGLMTLPALPQVPARPAPDAAIAPQPDPPPPGTMWDLDERGFVRALPEGALAPSGALVFAGRPGAVPPTRPGTAAPPESEAAPGAEAEAPWLNAMAAPPGRRPAPRPADRPSPAPEGTALAEADAGPAAPPAEALSGDSLAPGDALAALVEEPAGDETPAPGLLAFAAQPGPGGVSLDGLRPPERPDGLAPDAAVPVATAFAGPRPPLRPEGLAPSATAEAPAQPAAAEPPVDIAAAAVAAALASAPPTPPTAPEPPPQPAPAAAPAPDLQSTLAAIVQGAPDPLVGATRQAVPRARRPDTRPRNFDRVVADQLARIASAQQAAQQAAARQQAAAQPRASQQAPAAGSVGTRGLEPHELAESEPEAVSAAAAIPTGPTTTTVARAATFQDAIRLREINLIGVYGQPNARRALIRMGNGRYVRVGVGDRFEGGQITAIGDNALNYVVRGRTYALVIPGR
ncbi:hypothetical protein [Rubellimicrobium sp. CFH 75288]|uniref:hypothetical protein n=1 Tax=Rubellimicrobium sp. CFH 75288 TaxID=2697034 RepID=UPI00352A8C80